MSASGTSTVIFAWAALIVLWAAIFIFHRRLRSDMLEFKLTQISANVRRLAGSGDPLSLSEISRLQAAIQAGLQLSELWSGSMLLMSGSRSPSAFLHTPQLAQLRAEIGRVIAHHIVRGCPLLWPALLKKSWLNKLETKILAICFTTQSGNLQ
jgi:hypothetical protein